MAIVVEDGTGLATANSYVTEAEATAYATDRGVSLAGVSAKLFQAMDYLESYRDRYQGERTWPVGTVDHPEAQALQWPRTGVVVEGQDLAADAIPDLLRKAQMQMCIELQNGYNPFASSSGQVVKKTKVDVIEKEFFSAQELGIVGGPVANVPAVDALLAPLLGYGTGVFLRTVRV